VICRPAGHQGRVDHQFENCQGARSHRAAPAIRARRRANRM